MDDEDGQRRRFDTLATVTLPPLPKQTLNPLLNQGVALPPLPTRPGTAVRLRAPTPPPRPDSTLTTPSSRTTDGVSTHQLFSSLPGSLRSTVDPTATPSNHDQNITLTNPRTIRQQNVYVDTPIKGGLLAGSGPVVPGCELPPPVVGGGGGGAVVVKRPRPSGIKHKSTTTSSLSSSTVITQPLPACKKAGAVTAPSPPISITSSPTDSIICGVCGRCRCQACRSARPLPSTWVCDNTVLCSADAVVDKLSCMCCVRAGLYHCGELLTKDTDIREQTWVDSPCSCSSNKWCLRWSCLGLLSLPLPCLLCYPVLKGVTKLAEKCYQTATTQGCRCRDDPCSSPGALSPTDSQKRLLS